MMRTTELLAMVMTVGGTLQLVPQIRARAISFHRLTGKVFILTALFLAIGGLWMVWGRGSRLADGPAMGVSLNAIFIIVCASMVRAASLGRRCVASKSGTPSEASTPFHRHLSRLPAREGVPPRMVYQITTIVVQRRLEWSS